MNLPRYCDESGETHERKCEKTCGDECDRCAFHRFGDFVKLKAFPDPGKNYESKEEAESGRDCVNNALEKVIVFLSYEYRDTENGAVRRDERKEHAESLIKRLRNLFKNDLDHLHKRSDDKDVCDRLHETDI